MKYEDYCKLIGVEPLSDALRDLYLNTAFRSYRHSLGNKKQAYRKLAKTEADRSRTP